jgi:quercetin dioxygenase-like cupin family protein
MRTQCGRKLTTAQLPTALIKGDKMTLLEIHYAAGVGAPLHTHTHESIAYVVKGKVKIDCRL